MGKKCIIEMKEGERLYKTKLNALNEPVIREIVCEPYTEPDLEQVRKEAYENGYENGFVAGHLKAEKSGQSFYEDGHQRGLSDAWECARKIASDNAEQNYSIFGRHFTVEILNTHSASEAIEKIRAYEQAQKEKEEQIQVGDEVVGTYTGEEETEPFVIIRKIPEINPTYYFGIYSKSGEFCQGGLKLKKTGRHFPEIAEVLQKMKE